VGSRAQPVRGFSSFTNGIRALADWRQPCEIDTVALESTGVLGVPVFQMLADRGFPVCLVHARHEQNVADQTHGPRGVSMTTLFALGGAVVRASFRPEQAVCAVRTLLRHRKRWGEMPGRCPARTSNPCTKP